MHFQQKYKSAIEQKSIVNVIKTSETDEKSSAIVKTTVLPERRVVLFSKIRPSLKKARIDTPRARQVEEVDERSRVLSPNLRRADVEQKLPAR